MGLLAAFLAVSGGGLIAAAHAAAPRGASANVQRAREHFLAGKRAFEHKSYAKALQEFEEGYALEPRPGFLLNMGHASRRMGKLREARSFYTRFLATHPRGEEERAASQMIAEIDRELPRDRPTRAAVAPAPMAAPLPIAPPPAPVEPPKSAAVVEAAPPVTAAAVAPSEVVPPAAAAHPAGPPPTVGPSARRVIASSPASPAPPSPATLDLRPRHAPVAAAASDGAAATLVAAPSPTRASDAEPAPIYRRWWFWAGAGAVAAGVVTAIVVASSGGSAVRADGSWGQLKL